MATKIKKCANAINNLLVLQSFFSKGKNASLAQLAEQLIRNEQVAGSSPAGGSEE